MYEEYLQILILKLNKLEETLDFICPSDNIKKKDELLIKIKINLFYKFSDYFLKNSENKNDNIPDILFNRIISFIEKNIYSLNLKFCCKITNFYNK